MNPPKHKYAPGQDVGLNYTLLERLGKGEFGEVWRAEAPGGKLAALKIIPATPETGIKVKREYAGLRAVLPLDHPNLVPIQAVWLRRYDGQILATRREIDEMLDQIAGRDSSASSVRGTFVAKTQPQPEPLLDDFIFADLLVAMGLGEKSLGQMLVEMKAQKQKIPLHELLRYMQDAAQGIDYLNRVGKIHGDIKPSNLLLVGGGVQVCDYGLARDLDKLRRTSTAMGTPGYAAPELFEGHPVAASDQYCLAISYVEMRTGSQFGLAELPWAEQQVVAKATSNNPADRWETCIMFVGELSKVAGEKTRTRRGGFGKLVRWVFLLAMLGAAAFAGVKWGPQVVEYAMQRWRPSPSGLLEDAKRRLAAGEYAQAAEAAERAAHLSNPADRDAFEEGFRAAWQETLRERLDPKKLPDAVKQLTAAEQSQRVADILKRNQAIESGWAEASQTLDTAFAARLEAKDFSAALRSLKDVPSRVWSAQRVAEKRNAAVVAWIAWLKRNWKSLKDQQEYVAGLAELTDAANSPQQKADATLLRARMHAARKENVQAKSSLADFFKLQASDPGQVALADALALAADAVPGDTTPRACYEAYQIKSKEPPLDPVWRLEPEEAEALAQQRRQVQADLTVVFAKKLARHAGAAPPKEQIDAADDCVKSARQTLVDAEYAGFSQSAVEAWIGAVPDWLQTTDGYRAAARNLAAAAQCEQAAGLPAKDAAPLWDLVKQQWNKAYDDAVRQVDDPSDPAKTPARFLDALKLVEGVPEAVWPAADAHKNREELGQRWLRWVKAHYWKADQVDDAARQSGEELVRAFPAWRDQIPPPKPSTESVASRVRAAVHNGDWTEARRLLGQPPSPAGPVDPELELWAAAVALRDPPAASKTAPGKPSPADAVGTIARVLPSDKPESWPDALRLAQRSGPDAERIATLVTLELPTALSHLAMASTVGTTGRAEASRGVDAATLGRAIDWLLAAPRAKAPLAPAEATASKAMRTLLRRYAAAQLAVGFPRRLRDNPSATAQLDRWSAAWRAGRASAPREPGDELVAAWLVEYTWERGGKADASWLPAESARSLPPAYAAYLKCRSDRLALGPADAAAPDWSKIKPLLDQLDSLVSVYLAAEKPDPLLTAENRAGWIARRIVEASGACRVAADPPTNLSLLGSPFQAADAEKLARLLPRAEQLEKQLGQDPLGDAQRKELRRGLALVSLYPSDAGRRNAARTWTLLRPELSALEKEKRDSRDFRLLYAAVVAFWRGTEPAKSSPDDARGAAAATAVALRELHDADEGDGLDDATRADLAAIVQGALAATDTPDKPFRKALGNAELSSLCGSEAEFLWSQKRKNANWLWHQDLSDVRRGWKQIVERQLTTAIDAGRTAAPPDPRLPGYHVLRGKVGLESDNLDRDKIKAALDDADAAIAGDPQSRAAYGLKANSLWNRANRQETLAAMLADFDASIAAGERAEKDSPPGEKDLAELRLTLSQAHLSRGNFGAAARKEQDFREAVRYAAAAETASKQGDPRGSYYVDLALGNAYEDLASQVTGRDPLKDYNTSIEHFLKARAARPNSTEAAVALARCYFKAVAQGKIPAKELKDLGVVNDEKALQKIEDLLLGATQSEREAESVSTGAEAWYFLAKVYSERARRETEKNPQAKSSFWDKADESLGKVVDNPKYAGSLARMQYLAAYARLPLDRESPSTAEEATKRAEEAARRADLFKQFRPNASSDPRVFRAAIRGGASVWLARSPLFDPRQRLDYFRQAVARYAEDGGLPGDLSQADATQARLLPLLAYAEAEIAAASRGLGEDLAGAARAADAAAQAAARAATLPMSDADRSVAFFSAGYAQRELALLQFKKQSPHDDAVKQSLQLLTKAVELAPVGGRAISPVAIDARYLGAMTVADKYAGAAPTDPAARDEINRAKQWLNEAAPLAGRQKSKIEKLQAELEKL